MKEVLIGFTARAVGSIYQTSWGPSRCKIFLLKEDIDKVLSVDQYVWPSIIDVLKIEPPPKIGYVQGLWANLDNLNKFTVSTTLSPEVDYWIIGVTQFFDRPDDTGLTFLPFDPPTVQENWTLLGYDVAEETLLSGLSNMGYKDDEKPYAIDNFAHALNNYHLFNDYDMAQEFAVWTQSRDPGHGPWFVTGIYRI